MKKKQPDIFWLFLKNSQNSQENTCVRVSFLIKLQAEACNFIKKETLAQVFSCKFCESFKNTSFAEHLRPTTSENVSLIQRMHHELQNVKSLKHKGVSVNKRCLCDEQIAQGIVDKDVRDAKKLSLRGVL